jgi:membrane fusion protein, multidrug efflux system
VRADEANVNVAKEAIGVDRANLAAAELQLSYTEIRAPISGRTGNLNVQEGNMVRDTDTTPLVVINQISPIYVTFSVPEKELPDIRRYSQAGKLPVKAWPPGASARPETGVLDFIDNTVDQTTGTIRLKGLFHNSDRQLWPGQFLNATLDLTVEHNAVVVPNAAVQPGQNGQYVLVVDANLIAHEQPVETGPVDGNNTVILKGLAPGERVVVDGQLSVVPGAKVELVSRNRTPAAPAEP